jgi:hypothetical protein
MFQFPAHLIVGRLLAHEYVDHSLLGLTTVSFASAYSTKIKYKFNGTNLNDLSDQLHYLIGKATRNVKVLGFLRVTLHFTHFVVLAINEFTSPRIVGRS